MKELNDDMTLKEFKNIITLDLIKFDKKILNKYESDFYNLWQYFKNAITLKDLCDKLNN